jgi:hypothetical protein
MAVNGPWQWQWRRQHRRRRTIGCMLWILTLLAVLLVLALLFGGFQRGHKIGGLRPPGPGRRWCCGPARRLAGRRCEDRPHERHSARHR